MRNAYVKYGMQALAFLCLMLCFPVRMLNFENTDQNVQYTDRKRVMSTETERIRDVRRKETDANVRPAVAITFDDGPDERWTPVLLDGLRKRGVKATFFVIGENIEKAQNRDLIKRMYEEGHKIGNHTYSHADLSRLDPEDAHAELDLTDKLIESITGKKTDLVRPPFGAFPARMEQEIDKLYVKWTVDPLDWTTENVDEIIRRVVTETEENDIILLHDCYGSSVEAAFHIIDSLQEKGYEFVTVDRLLMD